MSKDYRPASPHLRIGRPPSLAGLPPEIKKIAATIHRGEPLSYAEIKSLWTYKGTREVEASRMEAVNA